MTSVSVVVAAFNAQSFIEKALRSALSQEGVSVDVIVVDDCSSDNTGAVVQALGDHRVTYHRLARNSGPAAARNVGLEKAQGEWVAILDADDAYEPGRLNTLTAVGRDHNADLVSDNFLIFSENDGGTKRQFLPETLDGAIETFDLASFAMANRLFISRRGTGYLKPIFRRSFIATHGLRYDPGLRIGEDYQLVAEALAAGAVYVRHRSAGYVYTTWEGSISHRLTPEDVEAMAAADQRFLATWGPSFSRVTRRSVEKHLNSLRDGAAFVKLVESLKRRDILAVIGVAFSRPSAVRHLGMPLQVRAQRLLRSLGLRSGDPEARRSLS